MALLDRLAFLKEELAVANPDVFVGGAVTNESGGAPAHEHAYQEFKAEKYRQTLAQEKRSFANWAIDECVPGQAPYDASADRQREKQEVKRIKEQIAVAKKDVEQRVAEAEEFHKELRRLYQQGVRDLDNVIARTSAEELEFEDAVEYNLSDAVCTAEQRAALAAQQQALRELQEEGSWYRETIEDIRNRCQKLEQERAMQKQQIEELASEVLKVDDEDRREAALMAKLEELIHVEKELLGGDDDF